MSNLLTPTVRQWSAEDRAIQTLMLPEAIWSAFDHPESPRTWIDYNLFFALLSEHPRTKINVLPERENVNV